MESVFIMRTVTFVLIGTDAKKYVRVKDSYEWKKIEERSWEQLSIDLNESLVELKKYFIIERRRTHFLNSNKRKCPV